MWKSPSIKLIHADIIVPQPTLMLDSAERVCTSSGTLRAATLPVTPKRTCLQSSIQKLSNITSLLVDPFFSSKDRESSYSKWFSIFSNLRKWSLPLSLLGKVLSYTHLGITRTQVWSDLIGVLNPKMNNLETDIHQGGNIQQVKSHGMACSCSSIDLH